MADIAIILDNVGNDVYAQNAREYLANPIRADLMRILLSTAAQINNVVKIRNKKSFGAESNRDISIGNYVSALNKTNLIIDVPLYPPLVLDGETSFQIVLEPNSEMGIMFYFDQAELSMSLTK